MVMRNIYKTAEHPFAPFVRILGKGKTSSRSLTLDEARQAMAMILDGEVEDVQLGAFLMLLRVKEESPEELAGFVQASRLWLQARRDQALALLRESDDSVQAVALRVGFREATVFIKAFRQWTGMTPGDYRARLKRRRGG